MGLEYYAIVVDGDIKRVVSTKFEREICLAKYKNSVPVKISTDSYIRYTNYGIDLICMEQDDGEYIIV